MENVVQGGKAATEAQEGVYVHPVSGHKVQQLQGFAIPAGYVYLHGLDEQPSPTAGEVQTANREAETAAGDIELALREQDIKERELEAREKALELQERANEVLEAELDVREDAIADAGGSPGEAPAKTSAAKAAAAKPKTT